MHFCAHERGEEKECYSKSQRGHKTMLTNLESKGPQRYYCGPKRGNLSYFVVEGLLGVPGKGVAVGMGPPLADDLS